MHLSKEQERILSGEKGQAIQKCMEILVGLGDIYDADSLIPIKSAHISGISIRTSGEAGLNFIEKMENMGAEVSVPSTINPAGLDLQNWKELGVPEKISKKQIRMVEAYKKIGARPICSCVPYLTSNRPSYGDHLAWSESSAIVFANSVLGAKTNREGAPSALASAITGLTPYYGYHKDENRWGTLEIEPDIDLFSKDDTFSYSVLGYWIGREFPESVPIVKNLKPTMEQHKALGAGMAASGAVALYHIPKVTAEAEKNPEICKADETVEFGSDEHEDVVSSLDQTSEYDLVCIGCPHASVNELKTVMEKAGGKETWVCLPREFKRRINSQLDENNLKLVCDTCMVVAPLSEMGYESIGVNSTKAAHYAPSLAGVKVHLASVEELVK